MNGEYKDSISPVDTVLKVRSFVNGYNYGNTTHVPKLNLKHLQVLNRAQTEDEIKAYHNHWLQRLVVHEDFSDYPVGEFKQSHFWELGLSTAEGEIREDSDGKYFYCTTSGNLVGIVKLDYDKSGYIDTLIGDLSADEGQYVDDASKLSYSGNKLTVAVTAGQKIYELGIKAGKEV